MMRLPFVRCAFAFVGLSVGFAAVSSSAHAERIISDLEASKLTFASLTAPPPVVRIHHVTHTTRQVASNHHTSGRSMVRLVSYHPKHATAHTTRRHRT